MSYEISAQWDMMIKHDRFIYKKSWANRQLLCFGQKERVALMHAAYLQALIVPLYYFSLQRCNSSVLALDAAKNQVFVKRGAGH